MEAAHNRSSCPGSRLGPLVVLLLFVLPPPDGCRAQPGRETSADAPPDSAIARRAVWIPATGPWRNHERATVRDRRGVSWFLDIDQRPLGRLAGGRGEVEISFPRLRVRRQSGSDTVDIGVVLPIDNRDLALFPPGAPEESAVPTDLIEDGWGRWPNLCQISFFDTTGTLDIDGNTIPEVALRRFCSCTARPCSGLVFLELGLIGGVRIVAGTSDLVGDVHLGSFTIEDFSPSDSPGRPVLKVVPDYLDGCRFLSLVGIRGKLACEDCCAFPVYLRLDDVGLYTPSYDPLVQSIPLERAKQTLTGLAAVDPRRPLTAAEEAQVAHAAAFFYLTGAGAETRGILLNALAHRQRDYRFLDLLQRLERFFRPRAQELKAPPEH